MLQSPHISMSKLCRLTNLRTSKSSPMHRRTQKLEVVTAQQSVIGPDGNCVVTSVLAVASVWPKQKLQTLKLSADFEASPRPATGSVDLALTQAKVCDLSRGATATC
ncbi:hypothetical protein AXG93_1864s1220 [Marchantia polymorpha subsp. ruderalis]|uniref:Uncharacterized protein n=1 Tax=Marchantia polymorpha subsp. ruderalis TaxID=1480154 RepID=A0A176WR43_MARPO|nr:hypothetical protein AXG93_1864s1220 [Marchantia polymorpha subsp. ruderalis]